MKDKKFKILKEEIFSETITDEFPLDLDNKNGQKLEVKGHGIYQKTDIKLEAIDII